MKLKDRRSPSVTPSSAFMETCSAGEKSLASGDDREKQAWAQAWSEVIDNRVLEWGARPESFTDEGITPPTRKALRQAVLVAKDFAAAELPPPSHVAPNGSGGIVFVLEGRDLHQTIEIGDDGATELITFRRGRLESRQPLPVGG